MRILTDEQISMTMHLVFTHCHKKGEEFDLAIGRQIAAEQSKATFEEIGEWLEGWCNKYPCHRRHCSHCLDILIIALLRGRISE